MVPSTSNARLQAWPGRVSSTCIYIQALAGQGQPPLGVAEDCAYLSPPSLLPPVRPVQPTATLLHSRCTLRPTHGK
jgi:hypothetical protein